MILTRNTQTKKDEKRSSAQTLDLNRYRQNVKIYCFEKVEILYDYVLLTNEKRLVSLRTNNLGRPENAGYFGCNQLSSPDSGARESQIKTEIQLEYNNIAERLRKIDENHLKNQYIISTCKNKDEWIVWMPRITRIIVTTAISSLLVNLLEWQSSHVHFYSCNRAAAIKVSSYSVITPFARYWTQSRFNI